MGNFLESDFIVSGLLKGKRLDGRNLFQMSSLKVEHDIFQQCFGSSRFRSHDIEITVSITESSSQRSSDNLSCSVFLSQTSTVKENRYKEFSRYYSEYLADVLNKLFYSIFNRDSLHSSFLRFLHLDVVVSSNTEITLEILFRSCLDALLNCELPDKEQNELKNLFIKSSDFKCDEYHAIGTISLFLKDPSAIERPKSSMSIFLMTKDNIIKTILKEDTSCFEFNDFLKLFEIKSYS